MRLGKRLVRNNEYKNTNKPCGVWCQCSQYSVAIFSFELEYIQYFFKKRMGKIVSVWQ